MKSSSLIKRFNKAKKLKEQKNNQKRHNYVTKLFFRIFLSSVILLICIITNVNKVTFKNESLNFTKLAIMTNSLLGNYLNVSDQEVIDLSRYDQLMFENNKNIIINKSFNGVTCIKSGIITSIYQNTNNLYDVTIIDENNLVYHYNNLNTIDYKIYDFVVQNEIIGEASNDGENFSYTVEIVKGKKYYDIENLE